MAKPKTADTSYVALLRGINVGGKNVIPMAALRRSFESMGLSAVRTLLASGNVVFRAPAGEAHSLEARLDELLSRRHRYEAKVVVRDRARYERMLRALPARFGCEPGFRYYVMFLRPAIDRRALLEELEVNDAMEELRYVPGALLWAARLDALTRSKVSKVIGKPIYREMTARNFRTVQKIHALLTQLAD
jgi:uncharacterized protein (DUF1697 family)